MLPDQPRQHVFIVCAPREGNYKKTYLFATLIVAAVGALIVAAAGALVVAAAGDESFLSG